MFENVGGAEILLILLVVLIFFGPKKIPELAQSLGKGIRKFNDAKEGFESQFKTAMKEPIEAMTGVKEGLEQKLQDAAAPLNNTLSIPIAQMQPPVAPAFVPPAATLARGASIEPAAITAAEVGEASTDLKMGTSSVSQVAASDATHGSESKTDSVPSKEA